MFTFVSIIHVIMCLILIIIVLLQTGKWSDLASAFGGGGSNTMFGSHGAASFLNRLTTVAAIMFMLTSLSLAILSAQPDKSILDDILPEDAPVTAPMQAPVDAADVPGDPEAVPGEPVQSPSEVPAGEAAADTPEVSSPSSEAMPETESGE